MELKNYFATDEKGNLMPMATCYLYEAGTETLAGGIEDINGNPLANPFGVGASALIQLAAPDGIYDLRVVKGSRDYRLRVQFGDIPAAIQQVEAIAADAAGSAAAASESAASAADAAESKVAVLRTDLANATDPAKGAGMVGYPLFALTRVSEAVSAIRGDYVTPEMFDRAIGAGDAVADTTAIRAALATGKTVVFNQPKTYLVKSDTSPLTGGPYQSYCLQTAAVGQKIILAAPCTIKQANGNNAVLLYMGHNYAEIINQAGGVFDGNRANQTDHATANDVIRSSATTGCKTYNLIVRNAASAGVKFDDCQDAFHWKPDVENCARNGIFHYGSRNIVLFPRVKDTATGQFANGIFFTASPTSVTTAQFVYDNVCIGFYVENAGDIGVESGIHCVNTLISSGTIKNSHNQGIIIRDNIKPRVHDVRIQVKTGGNIESALTVDSQLYKADSGDANAVLDAGGGCITGVVASNIGANGSGYEIEVAGFDLANLYAEGRGKTAGGSAYNIKASKVSGRGLKSKNIGNHIRLAGAATLSSVDLTGGTFESVDIIIKIEQLLTKSSIFDQKGIGSNYNVIFAGSGDAQGVCLHGLEDYDNPKRPISNAHKFVTSRNGFHLPSPAVQFGFTAIISGLQVAVFAIKADNGEVATFVTDGAGVISFLIESASIGPAGSSKGYRIELSSGEIVLKRYAVTQTISSFSVCRLI